MKICQTLRNWYKKDREVISLRKIHTLIKPRLEKARRQMAREHHLNRTDTCTWSESLATVDGVFAEIVSEEYWILFPSSEFFSKFLNSRAILGDAWDMLPEQRQNWLLECMKEVHPKLPAYAAHMDSIRTSTPVLKRFYLAGDDALQIVDGEIYLEWGSIAKGCPLSSAWLDRSIQKISASYITYVDALEAILLDPEDEYDATIEGPRYIVTEIFRIMREQAHQKALMSLFLEVMEPAESEYENDQVGLKVLHRLYWTMASTLRENPQIASTEELMDILSANGTTILMDAA